VGGDSQHLTKTAAAGSDNLALLGSRVVGGSGSGIVIALGTRTVMGKHVASIDALLAQAVAVPAQARLTGLRHRVAQTALVLAAALTLLAAVAQVGWQDYLWLLVALAAAMVPTGLAGELSVLHTIRSAPITWITRAASSDVGAKLTLVCLGTLGLALYHVPLGITVVQLVVLDLVAMLLPITALGGERPRAVSQHVVQRLLGFSALSGLLAYGSFLSFFWREGLSPAHLSPTSHLYFHAATIGFITLVLCRYLGLLYVRADNEPRFFTAELWRNRRLAAAFAISALVLVACLYLPVLRPYVTTWPLGPLDWLTIIVAGAVYLSCNQLERHTRRHTRQALLARHGTETLRKHLKLI
jgi:magnesium-transporting ATPase (P-type)